MVLFDTSVLFSAFYRGGVPQLALESAKANDNIAFCVELHDELTRTLMRKAGLSADQVATALGPLLRIAHHVIPPHTLHGACRDYNDDFILECALTAGATVIVSSDKDLLTLHEFRGIRILTPRQYLEENSALSTT